MLDKGQNKITGRLMVCCALLLQLGAAGGAAAREAAFAGKFYHGDKRELALFVDSALAKAEIPPLKAPVLAVIAPHAGYPYSGEIAAYAYKAAGADYDLVVILGVAHTMPVKGAALLAKGAYKTPLGEILIDEKLSAELIKASPLFEALPAAHAAEHSIEVQLPFLQRRLKKPFKLVAAVLNTEDAGSLSEIGRILGKKLKGRKALLVVSTDFSHYPAHDDAEAADKTLSLAVKTMDPGLFLLANRVLLAKGVPGLATCACGEAAVAAAMSAVNESGPAQFFELKYGDSHTQAPELSGPERVVGYLAGIFTGADKPVPGKILLDPAQEKELLREARGVIADRLSGKRAAYARLSKDPAFNLPGAVFVTITENGALRGCIGTIEARMGLLDAVRYGADAAAFHDGRFRPLKAEELSGIKLEISILSPLKKVADAGAVLPHKHGVVIDRNGHSGLFLPQVWEQIPEKKDFLSELCSQKAGMERGCWQDKKTRIYTFTIDAFRE